MDQHCIDSLDEFEGYPTVFGRAEVVVKDFDGDEYKAWVYLEAPEYFGEDEIKEDYLKRVLIGARKTACRKNGLSFNRV